MEDLYTEIHQILVAKSKEHTKKCRALPTHESTLKVSMPYKAVWKPDTVAISYNPVLSRLKEKKHYKF